MFTNLRAWSTIPIALKGDLATWPTLVSGSATPKFPIVSSWDYQIQLLLSLFLFYKNKIKGLTTKRRREKTRKIFTP
jgi:hypothetical protein